MNRICTSRAIGTVITSYSIHYTKLYDGFEAQDSRVFRELWKLARKAADMGLESAFKPEDNEAVLKELEKSDKGKKWLAEYKKFLLEHVV